MSERYTINDLYSHAWARAIENVIREIRETTGMRLFYERDHYAVHELIERLGVMFDADGNIDRMQGGTNA